MAEKVFTADLHTHLLEKKIKAREYWKIVKERHIDATAITEHAEFNPKKAFEILKATKPRNILLIPGLEINSSIGHVLVYGKDESVFAPAEFFEKGIEIKKIIAICKEKGFLLSVSHPWGFSHDSSAYIAGEKRTEKLVLENDLGVEAFNGMIGQLNFFVYQSNWIKRPMNFFEKLEKNRVAKKIKISKIGEKVRKKLDQKTRELIYRTGKAMELGAKAKFVTAGSDAHSAIRIGAGVMKIRLKEEASEEEFLKALEEKKGIEWIGPLTKQKNGSLEAVKLPRKKMEALQALKYAAKAVITKKVKKARIKQRLLGRR